MLDELGLTHWDALRSLGVRRLLIALVKTAAGSDASAADFCHDENE